MGLARSLCATTGDRASVLVVHPVEFKRLQAGLLRGALLIVVQDSVTKDSDRFLGSSFTPGTR